MIVMNSKSRNQLYYLAIAFLILPSINKVNAQTIFEYNTGDTIFNQGSGIPFPSDTIGLVHSDDLNGDGNTDLVVTAATFPHTAPGTRGPQTGLILFNNGDNTFAVADGDAPQSEHAREIFVADFNGDEISDIFIADHGYDADPFPGYPNQLLFGTGTGFTDVSDTLPQVFDFSHNAGIGDIDNDDDIDIYVANCCGVGSIVESYFLINDGNGVFATNTSRLPADLLPDEPIGDSLGSSFAADVADMDGDGYPDLIQGRRGAHNGPASRIYWNNGTGFYSVDDVTLLSEHQTFGSVQKITTIEAKAIDIDADGDNDLLIHAINSDDASGISVQLYINQGGRVFVDETSNRFGTIFLSDRSDPDIVPQFSTIADITSDGIEDIIWYGTNDNADERVFISQGRGLGCFKPISLADINPDENDRIRLIVSPPTIGSAGTGFAEISFDESNPGNLAINYLPLEILTTSTFPNWFDSCSNRLRAQIDASQFGNVALDFSLYQTEPTVIIQVIAESSEELVSLHEKSGAFNPETEKLLIPELVIDEQVAYTNVEFTLIDGELLLFQLSGSD